MAFLDPKKQQQEDDALPGSSGVHLDLDVRICPDCKREALPWEARCPACGVPTVAPSDVPASSFPLPAHLFDDEVTDRDEQRPTTDD